MESELEMRDELTREQLDEMETWEIQVKGKITVWKRNRRTGEYEHTSVAGGGPKMMQLTRDDRLYNQELIPEENAHLDPFTNGALARREGGELKGLTDDRLRELLSVQGHAFGEAIEEHVGSELTVRRLLELAENEGTMTQVETLREVIMERYKVGGTQRTVREMMEESQGGELLTG